MWNAGSMDTGGGYLNSPGYGSSQSTSVPANREKRIQNILSCSIAQIVQAEVINDNIIFNGSNLNQVSIIGLVRSKKEGSPYTSYEIDDMSGPVIEVRQFLDGDKDSVDDMASAIRENVYVRVCGNVRSFGGKRNIVSFKIRPVYDVNEITSHMLELLYIRAYNSKKDQEAVKMGYGQHAGPSYVYGDPPGGSKPFTANTGMNDIQQKVLTMFRMCTDDAGVSVQTITSQLRGVPPKAIRETVDFLASEGHIFSTIDDDHFRAIDSDF